MTVPLRSATGTAQPGSRVCVHQFQRKPVPGLFSIEQLFADTRAALPPDIDVDVIVNRRASRGILPRLLDSIAAWRRRGPVNHILGDCHYLAWWLPRATTMLTVLDFVLLETTSGLRRWLIWLFWYWWPLRHVGRVIVISEFGRRSLLSWVRYPADRISIVPPPLSPAFMPSPPREHSLWSRILQLGAAPNKNQARIIEALTGLDVTLVCVGRISPEIRDLARRLKVRIENHVDLTREQLVEVYRGCDMLAFASTYEGFGIPIVEAQAVGRPVVTGNVASMPEAAGGAACLVDPFDVTSIRAGIVRVLNDEAYATALIEKGFANAARYRPERIAEDYAALYRQLAFGPAR